MDINKLLSSRKTPIEFTDGQLEALKRVNKFLESSDNFYLLAGYSGCGKTTLAENIANATNAVLFAPTNAAVNRLVEKIDNPKIQFSTIHAALFSAGDIKNTFFLDKTLLPGKIYIVDECSMIDRYILEVLIKQATEKNCKIIFMGDSFQLEPVGDNPHIFEWEKRYPKSFFAHNKYELTEVKRYDGSLLKIATQLRTNKKPQFKQPEDSDLLFVPKFSKALAADIKSNGNYVVLTSTNRRRMQYNNKIRSYLFNDPNIDIYARNNDFLVSVSNSGGYANGEIYKIKNPQLMHEFDLFIENKKGTVAEHKCLIYRHGLEMTVLVPELIEASLHGQEIVNSIMNGITKVSLQVNRLIVNSSTRNEITKYHFNKKLAIATYGYAISCHKAQGQEWNNVYIDAYWLMPAWDPAKWFYTAITRAKCKVEVIQNKYLKIS